MSPPFALALVVLSALGWSLYDLNRKALVAVISPTPLLVLLTVGQVLPLAAWVAVAPGGTPAPAYWPPAAASVALNVVANLAFVHAFRIAPISLTIPLLSLTPAFATLAAVPLVGEVPSPRQVAGVATVVAGAVLVNLRRAGDGDDGPAAGAGSWGRALHRHRGAGLMVLVALCWSLTTPLDKLALRHASPQMHGFVLCTGVAVAVFAYLAARGRAAELAQARRAPGLLALALAVGTVTLVVQLVALQHVLVSLVETLKRGIGNLAALAYGHWLYRESITPAKLAGALAMAVGVWLIVG